MNPCTLLYFIFRDLFYLLVKLSRYILRYLYIYLMNNLAKFINTVLEKLLF